MTDLEKESTMLEKVWSSISHDLKTPLIVMEGESKNLEDALLPALIETYRIAEQDCVHTAIQQYQGRYKLKGKTRIHCELDNTNVWGDAETIQYMVYELLANAEYAIQEKESSSEGVVRISGEKDQAHYRLHLDNNGRALTEKDRACFFGPYLSNRLGAIGLGLNSCQQGMEYMQGNISATQESDGFTRFTLTFNLHAPEKKHA